MSPGPRKFEFKTFQNQVNQQNNSAYVISTGNIVKVILIGFQFTLLLRNDAWFNFVSPVTLTARKDAVIHNTNLKLLFDNINLLFGI